MTGLNTLVTDTATQSIADIVIKILRDDRGKLLALFSRTVNDKTQQLIFQAAKQYVQKYNECYGNVKVLGMQQPVTIESVYTDVQFLDEQNIRSFESIEILAERYLQAKTRNFQLKDGIKKSGLKVGDTEQYLLVFGGLGSGKTTFLKKMGLQALKGKSDFHHECIPVFIELKQLNFSNSNIEELIIREFAECGFPAAKELVTKILKQGKLLILLDGLDDLSVNIINEIIYQIQEFVVHYPQNRYIVSCRLAYRYNLKGFTDVAIADFNEVQIEQFITNWFGSEPESANIYCQNLNNSQNSAIKELAQTPLLLTLMCLLHQRYQRFPTNRSAFYELALRLLLEEWNIEKSVNQQDVYKIINTNHKKIILAQIAYNAFDQNCLFLPHWEVAKQIKQLLGEMLPEAKFMGATVLKSIEMQHGVLVERAEGIYSFSHLTFQEYLTAYYIKDCQQIEQLVAKHITDRRWQEVFLLVAGLMRGGTDELLLRMEKEVQNYVNTPKLQTLLIWTDRITTGSQGNFEPVAKRATAIANVLAIARAIAFANTKSIALSNTLSNAISFAIAIANANLIAIGNSIAVEMTLNKTIALAIVNTRKLDKLQVFNHVNFTVLIARLEALKAKVPNDKQPLEKRREFAIRFLQTWLAAINSSLELMDLSEEEATALENYLYINWLIVRCKQAAVKVSPKTWEAIEERMLLIPGAGWQK